MQGTEHLQPQLKRPAGGVAPALDAGLPALNAGWTYRSFRAPGTPGAPDPREFLRAGVETAPSP